MKRLWLVFTLLCSSFPIFAYTPNTVEIGIIAVPAPTVSKQAKEFNRLVNEYLSKQDSQIINARNIPHLSFYQAAIPVNRLDDLEKTVQSIARQTKVFPIHLRDKLQIQGTNIFWNAENYDTFKMLENKILDSNIPALRQGFLRQLEDPNTLPPEKQQLVKRYGIYWIKQLATPHITIFYDIPEKHGDLAVYLSKLKVTAQTFEVKYLGYGLVDYSGNVVKIIKLYALSK